MLLRIPLGRVHGAEVIGFLELLQSRLMGEAGAEGEQQHQRDQQQDYHIAAQAALRREPQAEQHTFQDVSPQSIGISTRKVWLNTSPSSQSRSTSSGSCSNRVKSRE